MTFITSDLVSGDAYTIWWVIFNNPEFCAMPGACAGPDLMTQGGDPRVQSSVLFAAGHVISAAGIADFAAHLTPSNATGALFGPGLLDPGKAEIHLLARTHGQPLPGAVEDQISSFNDGCPPNVCEDHQFAVHRPGQDAVSHSLMNLETQVSAVQQKLDEIKSLEDRIARSLSLKP